MKFCSHCGAEVLEEAVVCVKCGCSLERRPVYVQQKPDNTLPTVIKVFLIIGCVTQGWMLIPLAWCLPITISVFNKLRDGKPIGTGLKICTLLFVNIIAGICLLCMNEFDQ